MLDLSKIEAGKMELYIENFDAAAMVKEVVTVIQPLAEKNGNQVLISTSPGVLEMRTDQTKLRQTLFNLVSNANKFTSKGQITIAVSQRRRGCCSASPIPAWA